MTLLSDNQRKKINKRALADKYHCTPEYVGQILSGKREANTQRAQAILRDAQQLIEILEQ